MAAAETGSGKTGAFALPVLQICHEAMREQAAASSQPTIAAPAAAAARAQAAGGIGFGSDRDGQLQVSAQGLECSCGAQAWAGGRAGVGVTAGRYYYEVKQLGDGLCRVGWATLSAKLALGTDMMGFGFGGTGKKSNGNQFVVYGDSYSRGDVIGCELDREIGSMTFYKNGVSLGEAFSVPPTLKGMALFPAICLKGAAVRVNFGAQPFYANFLPGGVHALYAIAPEHSATNSAATSSSRDATACAGSRGGGGGGGGADGDGRVPTALSRQDCMFFAQGRCKWGAQCRYAHPPPTQPPPTQPPSTQPPWTQQPPGKPSPTPKLSPATSHSLLKQIEYYFSDNLPNDEFMQVEISKDDDGWVDLTVIAGFNRIKQLLPSGSVVALAEALKASKQLAVSEDSTKVRRRPSYRLRSNMRVLVGACDGRRSVPFKRDFPPGEDALRAAFASFDADGNGRLDTVEIQQALSQLGMAASSSEAFAVLQRYDTDCSGGLEVAEFARLVHEQGPVPMSVSVDSGEVVAILDSVDSGEVVAILDETPKFDHILVARQDGVRGYIRVRNLHVQAWPLRQRQLSLSATLTSHRFVWSSGELQQRGAFSIDGQYLTHGSSRHRVTVLGSHAFSVEGWGGYLLLLDAARTEIVLWDGAAVINIARAKGVAAATGAAPALAHGWQGVFTWAKHDQPENMGIQCSVSGDGKTFVYWGSEPPSPIVLITPHAWHHGNGTRVHLLDDSSDGQSTQRALTIWTPSVVAACIAFPTTYAGQYGAPADAWRLAPGRCVIAGNATHASGGMLLRRRPDLSLDAANRTDMQIFDGDVCTVLEVADGLAVPPSAASAGAAGEGLSTCAWVRVRKTGVGEGWLSTNNVHIQGHGYAPAVKVAAAEKAGAEGMECSFWFVNADSLRSAWQSSLPMMQTLRTQEPHRLVQKTISFIEGIKGAYKNILVVSHRWETPTDPDPDGAQALAVQAYLKAHPEIDAVWFDFSSMPQGRNKTPSESAEFKEMLPNINLLYLTCSVLILMDRSYMNRFWTQFEAYLSMRAITSDGLTNARDPKARVTIKTADDP